MDNSTLTKRKTEIENEIRDKMNAMYQFEKASERDDLIASDSWATQLKNDTTVLETELNDIKKKLAKLALDQANLAIPASPSLTPEQLLKNAPSSATRASSLATQAYNEPLSGMASQVSGETGNPSHSWSYSDTPAITQAPSLANTINNQIGELFKQVHALTSDQSEERRRLNDEILRLNKLKLNTSRNGGRKTIRKHYKKRGTKAIRSRRTTRRHKKKRGKKSRRIKRYN